MVTKVKTLFFLLLFSFCRWKWKLKLHFRKSYIAKIEFIYKQWANSAGWTIRTNSLKIFLNFKKYSLEIPPETHQNYITGVMNTLLQNYDYENCHIFKPPMSCTMCKISKKIIKVDVLNVFKVNNIDTKKIAIILFWVRYW